VPEGSAAGVRPGAKAEVRLFGLVGQTVPGSVTRVGTSMDPATRTMRVEIDLPNPTEVLRPGMYASVTLTPEPPPRVAESPAQK
jgi:cobalt-zinc-cadmium efflux system membrane fusion protein